MAENQGRKNLDEAQVEIIADASRVQDEVPVLTVRTGPTTGQQFFVRVRQPAGRAILIAVHL